MERNMTGSIFIRLKLTLFSCPLQIHQERHQPRRYRGHLQEGPRRHPRQPRPGGKEGQEGDQEAVDRQEAHLRGQEAEGQGPEGGIPRSNGGPVKTQNRYTPPILHHTEHMLSVFILFLEWK